jgi:hypothetical protein
MLNWFLALVSAILWTTAFAWYFAPEIRRWWQRRRERRAKAR